jgi:hypothetical protein
MNLCLNLAVRLDGTFVPPQEVAGARGEDRRAEKFFRLNGVNASTRGLAAYVSDAAIASTPAIAFRFELENWANPTSKS